MQKQTEQALKKAFITKHHAEQPAITLGIFVKELEDDVEIAQWIYDNCADVYPPSLRMHMSNLIEAQLKQNAGTHAVLEYILQNVAEAAGVSTEDLLAKIKQPVEQDIEQQAQQATNALLTKMRLH